MIPKRFVSECFPISYIRNQNEAYLLKHSEPDFSNGTGPGVPKNFI